MQFKIPKFGFKFKKRGNAAGFFGAKLSFISNHLSIINDKLFQNNHLSIINDKLSKKRINYKLSIFGKKIFINYKLLIAVGVLALAGVGGTLALNGFFGGGGAIPEDTMTRGLVGYWSFDEGDGTVARDASGNNNHGTLTNGPQWTKGKNGTALQFDGKNDYVDCGNDSSLDIMDAITVEMWVNLRSPRLYNPLIHFGASYGGNEGIRLEQTVAGGQINFLIGNGGSKAYITSDDNVLNGVWTHIVGVWDGTFSKLIINGITQSNIGNVSGPIIYDNATRYIGRENTNYVNGAIDEVRVYNRALTEAEVKYHYNHGGPVAYWDMDEGSGSVINDKSGNGNDGTLVNGATWAQGKHGSALSFDGVDDYASVANSASLNPTSKITVGLWAKRNGAGTGVTPGLLSKRANGFGLIWQVGADTERLSTRIYQSNGTAIDSGVIEGVLSVGEWRYINLVADGTNVITYVDGVPKKTVPYNGTILTGTALLTIGQQSNAYFNGQIDEVKIYDYARTEEEIRLDYNAGMATHLGPSGKTCSEDPAGCMSYGLVGQWDMDEGSGSLINDKSGNNNHGTLTNNPKWTKGKSGTALQFDGKDDYVDLNVSNQPDYEYTITTWFYPKSITGAIFYRAHCDGIVMSGSYLTLWIKRNNHSADSMSVPISDVNLNSWNFVAVTVNLRTAQKAIFINGKYVDGSTLNDDFPLMDMSNASIGYDSGTYCWGSKYFTGSIDETFFYKRALSLQELRYHYNQGKPVAQWDMDEGSGSVINDKSGNNNNGTLVNGTTWAQGKRGTALSFDGTDDYVDCGNKSVFNLTGAMTFAAWVAPGSGINVKTIVSKTGTTAAQTTFWMDIRKSNSWIYFGGYTSGGVAAYTTVNYNFTPGVWYYVAGTDDGTNLSIYVNGIKIKTATSQTRVSGSWNVEIGRRGSTLLQGWDGAIDDARIYNYARTEEEIRLDYNAGVATHLGPSGKTCSEDPAGCMDFGLAGHWDMDEGSGSVINDKSGNNNHGTLANGPQWTKGKSGTALQFDGKDDYVDCGDDASLNITDEITLEAWFKPVYKSSGNFGFDDWILVKGGAYRESFIFGPYSDHFLLAASNDGSAWDYWLSAPLVAGAWHHAIFTNKGGEGGKLYMDGLLVASNSSYVALKSDVTANVFLGRRNSNYYKGLIDEVRVYNRALSAEEVRYHYNQGKPVGYWAMDEGEGARAFDASGNNNTGVLTNGPTWVEGKHGSALSFDGVDDSVDVANDSSLGITSNLTIEAWVNPSAITLPSGTWMSIAGKKDGHNLSGYGLVMGSYSPCRRWCFVVDNSGVCPANACEQIGRWDHLVGVYDGSKMYLYQNGILQSTVVKSGNIGLSANSFKVASMTSYGKFNGLIDEVKVYNYARTAEQIMQDYNAGVATHLK